MVVIYKLSFFPTFSPKLASFQLDVQAFYRKTAKDKFIRTFKWDKIDICKLAADVDSYNLIRKHLKDVNDTFGGIMHRCPYRGFNISGVSLSLEYWLEEGISSNTFLPNGENSLLAHLYSIKDKTFLFYQLTFAQYFKRYEPETGSL